MAAAPEQMGQRVSRRASVPWWLGCLALGAVFLLGRVLPHLDAGGTSFPGYWLVARELLDGVPVVRLYDEAYLHGRLAEEGFRGDVLFGPPTLVLTALPVASLDYTSARAAWMLGVLSPALVVALAWLLRPLGLAGLVLFGVLLLGRPVAANMEVAQIYPLMLLAHCVGLHAWRRGRPGLSALGLAPMIAVRGWYGLPQALGWLVAGRWRGLVAAGLGAASLCLASLPVVGGAAWAHFLGVQLPAAGRSETAYVLAYQTWRSLALHLSTLHPQHSPDPPLLGSGPVPYLLGVAVILGLSVALGRRCRPGEDRGLGFALWTCAALLLAPVAEDHHFVLVALPVAVLWQLGDRRLQAAVALALLLLVPPWGFDHPELLGGWRSLLAYPRVYGVGLLWLGCLEAAWRLPARPLARAPTESPESPGEVPQ